MLSRFTRWYDAQDIMVRFSLWVFLCSGVLAAMLASQIVMSW